MPRMERQKSSAFESDASRKCDTKFNYETFKISFGSQKSRKKIQANDKSKEENEE